MARPFLLVSYNMGVSDAMRGAYLIYVCNVRDAMTGDVYIIVTCNVSEAMRGAMNGDEFFNYGPIAERQKPFIT